MCYDIDFNYKKGDNVKSYEIWYSGNTMYVNSMECELKHKNDVVYKLNKTSGTISVDSIEKFQKFLYDRIVDYKHGDGFMMCCVIEILNFVLECGK